MRETHINEYPEKAITHAGVFHADDVFAFAFLRIINPFIRLERVNKVTPDMYKPNTVVFDIGGGPFDHHTKNTMEWRDPDYKKHPYASFGKVVRGYGDWLFDVPLLQDIFDRSLVVGIDKHDCGFPGYTNEISLVINAYNPTWLEQASSKKDPRILFYERFMDAANLASQVIKRYIVKAKAMFASEMESVPTVHHYGCPETPSFHGKRCLCHALTRNRQCSRCTPCVLWHNLRLC